MKTTTIAAMLLATILIGCKKDDDTPAPAPAPITGTPCTYTLGPWSAWNAGVRTRTVSAEPDDCVGTMPATSENHYCLTLSKGFMRVTNYSSNPYSVTITGPQSFPTFTLQGGFMRDSIPLDAGTYGIHSIQLSGFAIFPSEFNATRNLGTCNVQSWSFP